MAVQAESRVSPDQYLSAERKAETKHEYVDGNVYAMAGGSYRHSQISANILAGLGAQLRGTSCEAHGSDLRVTAPTVGTGFFYPDISVLCGEAELRDDDTLLDPAVIVEVLSPSTAVYARQTKFKHYRTIPSLVHYMLVEQAYCWAEVFTKQPNGAWTVEQFDRLEDVAALSAIACSLRLGEIYDRVAVGPAPINQTSA